MSKSVLDLFGSLKGLLKLDKVRTDNLTFRLHYKVTVIIFVVCCVMVTAKQYIGEPIHCIVDKVMPQKFVDTFCWIHPTYTIPKYYDIMQEAGNGKNRIQTGVQAETKGQDTRQHHNYYQWVCFVLFFQSVFFYVPRYLWKNWEGGLVKNLTDKLMNPLIADIDKEASKKKMIKHLLEYLHKQNSYAYKFISCEVMNLINVVIQIYFMDFFLGNQFTTYGFRVFKITFLDSEIRDDPMNIVFPKLTKCELFKYGPSGNIMIIDSLCVLPLNIVNEKIYIVIWFWCFILAFFSAITFLYRIITLCSSYVRGFFLKIQCSGVGNYNTLASDVKIIMRYMNFGDCFLIRLVGKNVDPIVFTEIISELAGHLESRKNHNYLDKKKPDLDVC